MISISTRVIGAFFIVAICQTQGLDGNIRACTKQSWVGNIVSYEGMECCSGDGYQPDAWKRW